MLKIFTVFAALALIASCSLPSKASPQIEKNVAIPAADSVIIGGDIAVTISSATTAQLTIKGSQKAIDNLEIVLDDPNKLKILPKKSSWFYWLFTKDEDRVVTVNLALPKISSIELYGFVKANIKASVASLSSISLDAKGEATIDAQLIGYQELSLYGSGSSLFNITAPADQAFSKVQVSTAGSSTVTLSGVSNELGIDSSGAAKIDATKLVAQTVTVNSAGAARVSVNAVQALTTKLVGAGTVYYKGSPKLNMQNTGAATVQKIQ